MSAAWTSLVEEIELCLVSLELCPQAPKTCPCYGDLASLILCEDKTCVICPQGP